ncbi:hypothetical protein D3C73_1533300 [compost metagenome]
MFFSNLATSNLPTFSMAPSISLIGLPTRNNPFCNIRPKAELLERQTANAESKFPDKTFAFTCDIKLLSYFAALRIVR